MGETRTLLGGERLARNREKRGIRFLA